MAIIPALSGELDSVPYEKDPVFGLAMPKACPDVPATVLTPRATWSDGAAYDTKAEELSKRFRQNFAIFENAQAELTAAGPCSQGHTVMDRAENGFSAQR